jgi:NADH-quinone oxidoreductase subunit G
VLALGHVPVAGQDERFKTGFTIRAEKCPNRRGVEAVIQHFMGRVMTFAEFLSQLDSGALGGAWVSGGYKESWIDEAAAARFQGLKELVVQDLFDSPLYSRASFQLPGAAFPERDGSYVNFADRLQVARWAIRPPTGVWVEGQLYWRLLDRPGMFNARQVLSEVAAAIPYFSVAGGEVSDLGVDLKINQIAGSPAATTVTV